MLAGLIGNSFYLVKQVLDGLVRTCCNCHAHAGSNEVDDDSRADVRLP
jgi:hypothetical protein